MQTNALIEGGLLPTLIQWHTDRHPSSLLPDYKIDIAKIKAYHPSPKKIQQHLKSLGLQQVMDLQDGGTSKIGLEVTFQCPDGEVVIGGL